MWVGNALTEPTISMIVKSGRNHHSTLGYMYGNLQNWYCNAWRHASAYWPGEGERAKYIEGHPYKQRPPLTQFITLSNYTSACNSVQYFIYNPNDIIWALSHLFVIQVDGTDKDPAMLLFIQKDFILSGPPLPRLSPTIGSHTPTALSQLLQIC